jgi:hypothetical protein
MYHTLRGGGGVSRGMVPRAAGFGFIAGIPLWKLVGSGAYVLGKGVTSEKTVVARAGASNEKVEETRVVGQSRQRPLQRL